MVGTKKESRNLEKVNKDGKKVEMVPPDGGWGYMICFSLVTIFIIIGAPSTTFGLVYNDFLNSIGEGSSGISVMHAVGSCAISISGLLTTVALKRYSLRQVGLIGSTVATLGFFLQVFTTTIYEVIVYNAIVSTSLGILVSVVYTAFNSYFVKKRVYLLSMCKAIVGVSYMLYPMLIKWLMNLYGFRGTLAILAALSLNSLLGTLLIHPVSWHLVDRIIDDEANESNVKGYDTNVQIGVELAGQDKWNNNSDTEKKSNEEEHSTVTTTLLVPPSNRRLSTPTISVTSADRRPSMPSSKHIDEKDSNMKKSVKDQLQAVSMLSIGSFDNAVLPDLGLHEKDSKRNVWQTISSALDLKLLLDPMYLNIVVGMAAVLFSEMMFTLLFPMMLFTIGFSTDKVALSLSAYAAGDMLARFLVTGISKFIQLKPRHIFFSGVLISFSFRMALNLTEEFYLVAAISAVIGIAKCMTHLMIPLILGDHVPIEKYPAAYGLFMLFFGILNITLGPVVGIIRDITQSYKVTFDLLSCAFLICIVGWTVEFLITWRNKRKNNNK